LRWPDPAIATIVDELPARHGGVSLAPKFAPIEPTHTTAL
jgi:hypothetical protein